MIFSSLTVASSSRLDSQDSRRDLGGIWNLITSVIEVSISGLRSRRLTAYTFDGGTQRPRPGHRKWTARSLFSVPLGLMLLWVFTLWWGEKMTFQRMIADCAWARWENRSLEANPHHVILIADPQLVDPHTYPGRPRLLTALTIFQTDAFLRKSFASMRSQLMPDTVLFLGDLFDGGREWSTPFTEGGESLSPDKRWNKYGDEFWLKEYDRFGRIFLESWLQGRYQRPGQRGRKMIAELPGNHDLGFGLGVRIPVRKRFNAYFGEGNRVDMIGNFTFVSVDTVSLSANGQPDLTTGSGGADSGDEKVYKIWHPTEDFLSSVKEQKARVIKRELRLQAGLPEMELQDHSARELDSFRQQEPANVSDLNSNIPSILLTHVPLYRIKGMPCGKLREKYPPTTSTQEEDGVVEKDVKNALPVVAGLQYQTVLTPAISSEIIEKVGDIEAVFSGDDHDYCEVIHRGYTSKNGGVKEITLKAISSAAGIRKPGFLMLSLWNPIDAHGNRVGGGDATADNEILKTHLCLLPDQISILKRYGVLLGATLAILLVHAFVKVYSGSELQNFDHGHLLALNKISSPPTGPGSTSASAWSASNGLAVRTAAVGRTRNADPEEGYAIGNGNRNTNGYAIPDPGPRPGIKAAGGEEMYDLDKDTAYYDRNDWNEVTLDDGEPRRRMKKSLPNAVLAQWRASLQKVATVAVAWYLWLIWTT